MGELKILKQELKKALEHKDRETTKNKELQLHQQQKDAELLNLTTEMENGKVEIQMIQEKLNEELEYNNTLVESRNRMEYMKDEEIHSLQQKLNEVIDKNETLLKLDKDTEATRDDHLQILQRKHDEELFNLRKEMKNIQLTLQEKLNEELKNNEELETRNKDVEDILQHKLNVELEEKEKLQEENTELQALHFKKDDELQELRIEVESMKGLEKQMRQQILQEQLQKHESLEDRVEVNTQLKQLQEKLQNYDEEIQKNQQDNENLSNELRQYQEYNENLTNEYKGLENQLVAVQKASEKQKRDHQHTWSNMEAKVKIVEETEEKLLDAKGFINDLQEKLDAQEGIIADLRNKENTQTQTNTELEALRVQSDIYRQDFKDERKAR